MALAHEVSAVPFATPGYVRAFHEANGFGRLRIYRREAEGRLTGVLALDRVRSLREAGLQKLLTCQAGPVANSSETAIELLLEAAHDTGRMIRIKQLDGERHDVPRLISDLEENGCFVQTRQVTSTPYVDLTMDREAMLASLSKKRRQNLRRSRKQLEALGEVRFELVDSAHRAPQSSEVEALLQLEARSWKGGIGTAMISTKRSESLFRSIIAWGGRERILSLNQLYVDEELLAASFALRIGQTLYGMKTAYDERFKRYGPGILLLNEEILGSIDRGIRRVDLLGRDDHHKTDYATGKRSVWELYLGLRQAVPLAQLRLGGPVDYAGRFIGYRSRRVRNALASRRPRSGDEHTVAATAGSADQAASSRSPSGSTSAAR